MNKKVKAALTVSLIGLMTLVSGCSERQFNKVSHHHYSNYQSEKVKTKSTKETPSQQLAESVLTSDIKKQLGNNIRYNGHGAFIIDDNKSSLNADRNVAPYAVNEVDKLGRPIQGDAFINKTSRQYRNRNETGNGITSWKPQGFKQVKLSGAYSHLYDRGHLLGYANVGNVRGFNASESNEKNIATQTAWANEARDENSTGQNYFENIVRKAQDQNKTLAYRVNDLYEGNNLVPSGALIQAKSTDGSVNFKVFVPNVQAGIKINYQNGNSEISTN